MFGHINHLVLKVTRDCNLRCKYCYVKNKDSFRDEVITIDVVKKIIKRLIFDKKKNKDNMPVNITLHGGEPTKIGKDRLYEILEYISLTLKKEKIPFELSIQTNLTLIDEDIAAIFNKFNVGVGFSFDGLESNKLRTDINDDFFIDKMRLLQRYKVSFGPLIVITKENYKSIFTTLHYLKKEFNIEDVKLNYAEDIDPNSDNQFELNGKEFFNNVWKKVIDDFIKNKTKRIHEPSVERIVRKFVYNQLTGEQDKETGNCGIKFCGGGMRVIEVEPSGDVFYCGRFSESYQDAKVGSVDESEFLDIQSYKRYIDFIKSKDDVIRKTGCDACPAKNICDYGCMAFHYSKKGEWGIRKDLVCDLYIPMHNYLYKHRNKIMKKIIKLERKGDFLDLNLGKNIKLEGKWR